MQPIGGPSVSPDAYKRRTAEDGEECQNCGYRPATATEYKWHKRDTGHKFSRSSQWTLKERK
jgi:hypothetical protein